MNHDLEIWVQRYDHLTGGHPETIKTTKNGHFSQKLIVIGIEIIVYLNIGKVVQFCAIYLDKFFASWPT